MDLATCVQDTAAFPIVPKFPLLDFIAVETVGLLAVLIA